MVEGIVSKMIAIYLAFGAFQESIWLSQAFIGAPQDSQILLDLMGQYLIRIFTPDPVQIVGALVISAYALFRGD